MRVFGPGNSVSIYSDEITDGSFGLKAELTRGRQALWKSCWGRESVTSTPPPLDSFEREGATKLADLRMALESSMQVERSNQ